MPEAPSRSQRPSCQLPSFDFAGSISSVMLCSARRTSSSTAPPSSAAMALEKSSPQFTSLPSTATMQSPARSPASSAGETFPSAVSTSVRRDTTTPPALSSSPTVIPPGTSSCAHAEPDSPGTHMSAAAKNNVIEHFFIFSPISFPSPDGLSMAGAAQNNDCNFYLVCLLPQRRILWSE